MALSFSVDASSGRVLFGAGAVSELAAELEALGARRVAFITTPRGAEAAEKMGKELGERYVGVHANAEQHAPAPAVTDVQAAMADLDADTVVAVGGGSAIGLAKVVPLARDARIVAIPTTYSGSEMTPIYGITEDGKKRTAHDERVRPSLVIYDPELSRRLPVATTVTSGFNAMAHAVEAMYAPQVDPVTQIVAEQSLVAFAQALPVLVDEAEDAVAREQALYGAYLAGVSLRAGIGLHHKLCHLLGGKYGTPHAETHTVLLPYVTRYTEASAPDVMGRIARALGGSSAAQALRDLAKRVRAPVALSKYGFDEAAARESAEIAVRLEVDGPRAVERDAIERLLIDASRGDWG